LRKLNVAQAHNLKVVGSNPTPATSFTNKINKTCRALARVARIGAEVAEILARAVRRPMVNHQAGANSARKQAGK
jgi:hypothetical protein